MTQITVLHIINDLGVGGAQRVVVNLASKLNQAKFRFIVINLNFSQDNTLEQELKQHNCKIINIRPASPFDFRSIFWIARIINRENVDIVHTHLAIAGVYGKLAAKLAKRSLIVSTEHNTSSLLTKPWYYRGAVKFSYRLNTKIIAVSECIRKLILVDKRIPQKKVELIYNGIDLDDFKLGVSKCKDKRIFYGSPIIGSIGRNDPRKGFQYLYEAFNWVKISESSAQLLIAANNSPANSNNKNGISNCFLPGEMAIRDFLSSIDIFVLASIEEGLGIAVLEAMAMNKPVIATNVGGIPEIIIHKNNGLLVPAADSQALANTILSLWKDKALMNRLAQNGRQIVVERFSLSRMIKQTETLYEELIRTRSQ
ncbi:glycosyltransferase family 4 protein [candidate division KSB1 bacterium]|nr:glycosyltransferase family 4 protein [candidate division KSB1 bacterium]